MHTRIARGISQIASVALEHARAREALEEANRLKSEFVATMSHELRTPLNIMLGYNEMLLGGGVGPLSGKQQEILSRSDDSAHQLLQLITDTLDLSRFDSGRVALACSDVSLDDLFGEIRADLCMLRKSPHVRVVWDIAEHLPSIWTDPGKLTVVIKNLLVNAYKFTDQGEVRLRVRVADEGLDIRVEDTGIGIPSSALGYIFEPFRQVDSSTTRRHEGAGLGLYIVRQLLELLGGTIRVTSEPGVGTAFQVQLPLTGTTTVAHS